MPAITVRNLSPEVHRALKMQAARHNRSTEAEIREILEAAIRPSSRVKIGSELAAIGAQFGKVDLEVKRDQTPIEPAVFE